MNIYTVEISFLQSCFNYSFDYLYKTRYHFQFDFHLTKCNQRARINVETIGWQPKASNISKETKWKLGGLRVISSWSLCLSCKSDSSVLRDRMSLHLETNEWRRGKRTMPSALIYVIKRCNFHTMSNIHCRECRICRLNSHLSIFSHRKQR